MTDRKPQTSLGEALIRLLEGYGVDTIFGIPGVHTVELYRGMAGSNAIRHVLVRHEQGAGFMADGYARATGRPGVCFVITGPGVTNIMTPLGQAYSDSVPLLVISSVNAARDLGMGRGRLHEMTDQRAAAATVTAFSATALGAAEVPELLARAFAVFQSSRPRPVHIEIPLDVLSQVVEVDWQARRVQPAPAPDPRAVDAAVRLLAGARRPVIVAGGGAVGAAPEVKHLAERLGAAVVPTVAGKGILTDDHPLCLGAVLPQPDAQAFVAAADVVLAVGSELSETDFWCERLDLSGALIRVDIDPRELADDYPAEVAILSDAAAAVAAISQGLEASGPEIRAESPESEIAELYRRIVAGEAPLRASHRKVLDALRAALPEAAIVASDMTQIAYSANEIFPVPAPRSWLHPAGFGTLGYALPAAIGAKLGAPERPVVALAGDYGFLFTVQEMQTAAELGLQVIVVLWNNEALAEIRDDMVKKNVAVVAVEQTNPDFQQLATSFGWHATRPAGLAAFQEELRAALKRRGPSFIEVRPDAI